MTPPDESFAVSRQEAAAVGELDLPPRLLLGPGPSNAHPRVLRAMSMPQVGHLDPAFIALMNENQKLLRYAWQTANFLTIPVSGTGSAAMEACFANLVEPDDCVLVCRNGYFGHRMADMASRYGARVAAIEKPWGEIFSPDEIHAAIQEHRPAVVGIVHAETSTGACQPLEGIGELCREHNSLLLVDTVTSLGGVPLSLDAALVDAAYSGSQKCLSCPPGIAPLTFGSRAVEKLAGRESPVANWYLDLTMVSKYWGSERTYHHTAPITMNYGLREALRLVAQEGLEARWSRHRRNAEAFWTGLEELGLQCHVAAEYRLPSLTTVRVPDGVNPAEVQAALLSRFNIEIAGGLGELAGKVWRVGLMGHNSREENVQLLLSAMRELMSKS